MPIPSTCPRCQAGYSMPEEMLGMQVRCNKCQTPFVVRAAAEVKPGVQAVCPGCKAAYSFPAEQRGQKVRCGKCQLVFLVPPGGPALAPAPPPAALFQVACPGCRTAYSFPPSQLGQKVRCNKCQTVFLAQPTKAAPSQPAAKPGQPPTAVKPAPSQPAPRPAEKKASPLAAGAPPTVRANVMAGPPPSATPAGEAPRGSPAPRKSARGWLIGGGIGAGAAAVLTVVIVLAAGSKNEPPPGAGGDPALAWQTGKGSNQPPPKVGPGPAKDGNPAPKGSTRPGPAGERLVNNEAGRPAGDQAAAAKEKPGAKAGPGQPAAEKPAPAPEEEPAPADGPLPAAVLARVKQATVYLRVTLPDGAVAQGSGFFGLEKNIVLTNAHVLGMLRPDSRKPQKIDVVLNSGTPREKTLAGEVLGVDRSTDLAVLRVRGAAELPPPLAVRSAKSLSETQTVYVIGFPLGAQLGKNVSVRKLSVSSLRTNALGILQKIQVEGGMDPGNSGGPVVNTRGDVIGVAVSKIMATQINFAVPGDYVQVIVNGRVTAFGTAQPYKVGADVRLPVRVYLLDPLNRVRKVFVEYWAGRPGKPRPASLDKPKPEPDDGPIQTVELPYKNGLASGEVTLPTVPPGQVVWRRPVIVDGAGTTKWAGAAAYVVPPPLERRPALLVLKQVPGGRNLTLHSSSALRVVDSDGDPHELRVNMESKFQENTTNVSPQGAAVALSYRQLRFGLMIDKQLVRSQRLRQVVQDSMKLQTFLRVDSRGKILSKNVDSRRVPQRSRETAEGMHEQVEKALEAIAIPVPGKEVAPGTRWSDVQPLSVGVGERGQSAVLVLTYTYLGTRVNNGREEAYIEIGGRVRGPRGRERQVGGKVTGTGLLDLASGQFSSAKVTVAVDLDMRFGRGSAKANGTLEVTLTRDVAGASAAPRPTGP